MDTDIAAGIVANRIRKRTVETTVERTGHVIRVQTPHPANLPTIVCIFSAEIEVLACEVSTLVITMGEVPE